MELKLLTLLGLLSPLAYAGITFNTPAAGASAPGGGALSVSWTDSGSPKFTAYTLSLCAGGNEDGAWIPLTDIVANGQFSTGSAAQGAISAGIGASIPKNAYFLKMVATGTTGSVTYFSSRFTLTGMTGSFPDAVLKGANAVTGTTGPATVDNTNAAPAAGAAGGAQFTVPFGDQIGLTRWAPMQAVPPTKITKSKQTPLYPTSSISGFAAKALPIPTIKTTITQVQTFSVQSRENTAAAAAMPSDDMAKFLARWKD